MENPTAQIATSTSKKRYVLFAVIVVLVLLAAFLSFSLIKRGRGDKSLSDNSQNQQNSDYVDETENNQDQADDSIGQSPVFWSFDGTKWATSTEPPACPTPLTIQSPVDLSAVTSIIYPGQTRNGDYKPHGGFRLDNNTNNTANVTMPMTATLWRGSRYIENGEVQHLLDFIAPCGIMFRFDHLLTLSPTLAAIVETELPEAKPDDSRTIQFKTQKEFLAGDLVATEIGFQSPLNVSFDLGVYNLREPNSAYLDSNWAISHADEKDSAFFAVCWLEFLSDEDEAVVKALPASGSEGKSSDYCE